MSHPEEPEAVTFRVLMCADCRRPLVEDGRGVWYCESMSCVDNE